ncbi:FAD-dependent monooxygenase [Paeniglutamicibacter sp.]|uniref:FAD-dependent monooxygenase n=1 Tax=Paeniglutamicibacter sp. TaxID=1934391 RepID=UPI0039894F7B
MVNTLSLRKCLVIGAGIGGLGAAVALGRKGWTVDVIELKPDSSVAGVGINQPGNSLRALDDLGVLEQCLDAGFAYDRNTHFDWQGSPIVETLCHLGGGHIPPNNALSRSALHEILTRAALENGATIRYGTTVEHLLDEGDQVEVQFTDGTRGRFDAIAAFDGIRSPMRRRLFGESHEPTYTGYAVWRAMLPRPASVGHTQLFHGDRSNTGLIPLSPTHMYLLHVSAEPQAARYEPADFGRLLGRRLAGYGGIIATLSSMLPRDGIVYSPLSEVHLPPPWHRGRAIVLGDGAHASAPNLTQGAAMALEDAVVLADELSVDRPVEESLAAVTALRAPRTQLVQEVSHGILMAEMAVTADSLPQFADDLRAHLPGRAAFVEAQLNRPFRSV